MGRLNFTEFLDAFDGVEPIYEVKGKKHLPSCPRGHRWSKKDGSCVAKTDRDSVSTGGKKDASPDNGPQYNVIGRTGVDGDGYAWAEPNNWGGDSGGGGGVQ